MYTGQCSIKDTPMDDAHMEKVINQTVKSTLTQIGFDLSDPIKIQEDMHFLRALRGTCQAAGTKVIMVLVGVATVAVAGGTIVAVGKAIRQALMG